MRKDPDIRYRDKLESLRCNVTQNLQGGVPFIFSAPEPEAQVHYCDHALSVVRLSSVVRRR